MVSSIKENEFWQSWKAVQNAPFNIQRVSPITSDSDVFMYSDDYSRIGFLTEEKLITPPLYTLHYHVLSAEKKMVAIDKTGFHPVHNKGVVVNFESGQVYTPAFAAYSFSREEKVLRYRIDDTVGKGKWYSFNLETKEISSLAEKIKD